MHYDGVSSACSSAPFFSLCMDSRSLFDLAGLAGVFCFPCRSMPGGWLACIAFRDTLRNASASASAAVEESEKRRL